MFTKRNLQLSDDDGNFKEVENGGTTSTYYKVFPFIIVQVHFLTNYTVIVCSPQLDNLCLGILFGLFRLKYSKGNNLSLRIRKLCIVIIIIVKVTRLIWRINM